MAMSKRLRDGGNAGNRLSKLGVFPVYEDFNPTSEWKHEELADILLYHLPGFEKEQIRIVAETRGILRIQGERRTAENKYSRFKQEIELPKNCDMKELRAKFEKGILQIIIPKQTITTTQNKQKTLEEKPTIKPELPNNTAPKTNTSNLPHQIPTLPSNVLAGTHGTARIDPSSPTNNIRNPIIPRISEAIIDSNDDVRRVLPPTSEYQGDEHERMSMKKVAKESQPSVINESTGRSKSSRNLEEDKQLITNMGVAILVIFSLGAYISYSFR